MMKQIVMSVLVALGIVFAGHAAANGVKPPDETIKQAVAEIQDLLGKNHAKYVSDKSSYFRMVDEKIVPHFDVPYIARSVLGRAWKTASDEQRKRFQEAFKSMLIRSYADALLEHYDSVQIDWKPVRMGQDSKEAIVNTSLVRHGKPPVAIGFSMHRPGDAWKIYDITVENLSLIQNFRGQFSAELKRSSLDEMIQRMETGQYSSATPSGAGPAAGQGTARP